MPEVTMTAVQIPQTAKTPRRRPSRAKPRPPRARQLILAELRGLGGLVLEQGLLAATARPPESLVTWQRRLADELDVACPSRARTYREMLHQIVALSREGRAGERLAA
jgi:hypothetical protein